MRLVYGYDKTDKLTSIKSYAADASALDETHFWYDRRGLLIKASNLAALVEFERDGNGRVIREMTNGRSIESKLDARGNRIERRIGGGEPGEGLVKIGRDPLGMVASIAIDDHTPLVFTRDALGRETSRASAKGFRLEQSFDAVGQLMHQRVGIGVAERRYGWDKAGAPTSIDDAIWGETRYTYDVNGQVAKAEFGDGFTEKFAYDPAKNVAGVFGDLVLMIKRAARASVLPDLALLSPAWDHVQKDRSLSRLRRWWVAANGDDPEVDGGSSHGEQLALALAPAAHTDIRHRLQHQGEAVSMDREQRRELRQTGRLCKAISRTGH